MCEIFRFAIFTLFKKFHSAVSAKCCNIFINVRFFCFCYRKFPFAQQKIFPARRTKMIFQRFFRNCRLNFFCPLLRGNFQFRLFLLYKLPYAFNRIITQTDCQNNTHRITNITAVTRQIRNKSEEKLAFA